MDFLLASLPSTAVPTYFWLALVATIGYSVQNTLMASFYRRMDRLSAVTYRGLSLAISMLPLLLFVPYPLPAVGMPFALCILGAAITAAAANWYGANAYSFLPVGIATALSMSFTAVVAATIGYFVFHEALSLAQLTFIAAILLGILLLGAARSTGPLPAEYNMLRGLFQSLMFGLLLGLAFALVGLASKHHPAFLVGYLWELTIGIVAAITAWLRGWLGGPSLAIISRREFGKILLCASPTIIGTGFYALATTMGKIGVVTAIMSTMIVFNTLLAMVLYKEKLTRWQWCLLVLVCLMVVGLKLSSDRQTESRIQGSTTAELPETLPRPFSGRAT